MGGSVTGDGLPFLGILLDEIPKVGNDRVNRQIENLSIEPTLQWHAL